MLKLKQSLTLLLLIIASSILYSCDGESNSTQSTVPGPNLVGAVVVAPTKFSVNSRHSIDIIYQTSQGNASNLNVDLSNLPRYWSYPSSQGDLTKFHCEAVTSDNGCNLALVYIPLESQTNESFNLAFSYTNSYGQESTGNANIIYSAESGSHVIYKVNPPGLVNPALGVTKFIDITFNTDESMGQASNLEVTALDKLPLDWKVNNALPFKCPNLNNSDNSCLLSLSYTPTKAQSGIISLDYNYVNNKGLINHDSIILLYNVGKGNSIIANYPQSIALRFGESRTVKVNFQSSDSGQVTNLKFDLTTIETDFPGWSSSESTYICSNITNPCPSLNLTYAPESTNNPTSGNLILPYSYKDRINESKEGTIHIYYYSDFDMPNFVLPLISPTAPIGATLNNAIPVAVNFSSTGMVTNLQINSGLTTLNVLNHGWSTTTPKFNCNTISLTNSSCNLELIYKPTSLADWGTIVLGYSYNDNLGNIQNNSFTISYHPQTHNYVMVKLSDKVINGIVGDTSTLDYSFITNDGLDATDLNATIDKGNSSGAFMGDTLHCNLLNADPNLCNNTFSYTPSIVESGYFTIKYNYINSAGDAKSETESIIYNSII